MVDLNGLADKAKDLAAANADKIDDVVDKVAGFAGDKFGHDKVAPVRDKVKSLIPRQPESNGVTIESEEEAAPEA